jgi:hypothetical protein
MVSTLKSKEASLAHDSGDWKVQTAWNHCPSKGPFTRTQDSRETEKESDTCRRDQVSESSLALFCTSLLLQEQTLSFLPLSL